MSKEPVTTTTVITPALKTTFTASYLVLMGYTGLTLIEALRTNNTNVRHVMNIETTVSLVAGLVYGIFNEMIKSPTINLHDITKIRYIDWSITTPLIILVILLFYGGSIHPLASVYGSLVLLNWGMLGVGYLGEEGTISRWTGCILGFLFFAAMLMTLYSCCVPAKANPAVFFFFAIIWSFYGIAYMLDEENKNIMYNVLDVISKAIFGVVLYLYFGKVLDF
jgi:bacteriorhodopsin